MLGMRIQRSRRRDGDIVQVQERADGVKAVRVSGSICGAVGKAIRTLVIDERIHGGWIVGGLVDDQVGDRARLGVDDEPCRPNRRYVPPIQRCGRRDRAGAGRAGRRRRIPLGPGRVVERSIDRPQSEGHERVRHQGRQVGARCVLFRNQDLLEDELEIRPDQSGHDLLPDARPCITRVCKWLKILMTGGFADLTRM